MPNCPQCGAVGAYVGFNSVECANPHCQHFKVIEQKGCPCCGNAVCIKTKHQEKQGQPITEKPLIEWSCSETIGFQLPTGAGKTAALAKGDIVLFLDIDSWTRSDGCDILDALKEANHEC